MDNTGLVYLLNLSGQALEQANAEIARLTEENAQLRETLAAATEPDAGTV